jgi:protein gp37
MRDLLRSRLKFAAELPHIWWGVSVENKKHGLQRLHHLQSSPARVRFLSIEPLLEDIGPFSLTGINWVIVGGESGAGARLMKKSWVISIRNRCRRAKVPFFFKQWGGVRKNEAGRSLDGKTYDEFPLRTEAPIMDYRRCLVAIEEIESSSLVGAIH